MYVLPSPSMQKLT